MCEDHVLFVKAMNRFGSINYLKSIPKYVIAIRYTRECSRCSGNKNKEMCILKNTLMTHLQTFAAHDNERLKNKGHSSC